MTHLFIGIGNAGGAISDAVLTHKAVRRAKPLALKITPERDKVDTLEGTLKELKGVEFAFVFSALSESTVTPHIAELLDERNLNVLLVGILPATRREKREHLMQAYHSMDKLKEHVTAFLIVDNQRLAHLPNFEEYYTSYNRYIASCIADMLTGTSAPGSPSNSGGHSPLPLDAVVKGLSFDDEPGYVALSRASELTKGLWGYIFPFLRHKPLDLRTLLRVSLEKFSVSDAPPGCEKSVSFLHVPDYYVRSGSVDREQVEEFMLAHSKEFRLAVTITTWNIAAITNLFTYTFDQLDRLREIRRLADEGV